MGDRDVQKTQRLVARKPLLSMRASKQVVAGCHHFLDRFGNFPTIEEMLENGRATVILALGALTEETIEPNDARMVA